MTSYTNVEYCEFSLLGCFDENRRLKQDNEWKRCHLVRNEGHY
jgi:hypothetical protein